MQVAEVKGAQVTVEPSANTQVASMQVAEVKGAQVTVEPSANTHVASMQVAEVKGAQVTVEPSEIAQVASTQVAEVQGAVAERVSTIERDGNRLSQAEVLCVRALREADADVEGFVAESRAPARQFPEWPHPEESELSRIGLLRYVVSI